jgi:hypothetical protein
MSKRVPRPPLQGWSILRRRGGLAVEQRRCPGVGSACRRLLQPEPTLH